MTAQYIMFLQRKTVTGDSNNTGSKSMFGEKTKDIKTNEMVNSIGKYWIWLFLYRFTGGGKGNYYGIK